MDASTLSRRLIDWLQSKVAEAGTRGVVFGMSGGLDSSVLAALCRHAFPEHHLGLILPCHSDPRDTEDALLVAATLDIRHVTVELDGVYDRLLESLRTSGGSVLPDENEQAQRLARANLKPRLRMCTLYYFANRLGYLVVGSSNRSELEVGYFTKYGDGGVDLAPLGALTKTEVRQLAQYLGIPARIIQKPPSAGLWPGQTDEEEMGITYEQLDAYLRGEPVPPAVRQRIEFMQERSAHKRQPPPICPIGGAGQ